MGYWGHIVVARNRRPLSDLAQVRVFGTPDHEQPLTGDWKKLWVMGNHPPDLGAALRPVVGATHAPALVAFILDSDCAVVRGTSPAGAAWGSVINRRTAEAYDGILEYDTPDHGLSGSLKWGREAGMTPTEPAVRDALNGNGTFAEDQLDQLLSALGIRA